MCLPHHQLVLRKNNTAHSSTNGIKDMVRGSSHRIVIVREGLLGGPQFDFLQLPSPTTSKLVNYNRMKNNDDLQAKKSQNSLILDSILHPQCLWRWFVI